MSSRTGKETEYQDAVIYARYSSHNQRDVSIEQQVRECQQFAKRNGLQVVGVYDDHALTGTNDKRPAFQKMIRDAKQAGWSYVIVYSLDRFARDRYDSAVYKRQLRNLGIRVLSAMENIGDDPTGVLMEGLLESLAEYYSRELGSKVKRGMTDNASRCQVNGKLPLGYVKGPDGKYAIDENEAAIVREIYQRVSDQEQLSCIVQDLNARGLQTKEHHKWNKSSFNTILSNERYTGVYIYGDTKVPGGIPAIISQELFDKVQYAVTNKKNPRSLGPQRRRREKGLYMLTGKLFCGECKEPLVGICGTGKSGRTYNYYVCRGKLHKHCRLKNIPRDDIELFIATALKATMLTDEAIVALADATIAYQQRKLMENDIGPLRSQLADTERSLNNLVKAIEKGIFSESTQSRLQELETQKRVLSGQLAIAQEEASRMMTREQIIAALMIFQEGDVRDKEFQLALIDTFLVAAYVYEDQIKFVFRLDKDKQTGAIPFDIDDIAPAPDVSDSDTGVCIDSGSGDHTVLYKPFGTVVVMIQGLFVFTRKR